jgi:hypothetical protein
VAVADQSLHHVGAHLAEADKSDLHDLPLQLLVFVPTDASELRAPVR